MKTLVSAACLVMLLGACGGAAAAVSPAQARDATYNTDFDTVWKAVSDEIRDRYKDDGIKSSDKEQGLIVTNWKTVDVEREATTQADAKDDVRTGNVFQVRVKIVPGGPPWHVEVDGEAARYRAGMTMLTPYAHGASDEPGWVSGRIDAVRGGIYDRLKQYAVTTPGTTTK